MRLYDGCFVLIKRKGNYSIEEQVLQQHEDDKLSSKNATNYQMKCVDVIDYIETNIFGCEYHKDCLFSLTIMVTIIDFNLIQLDEFMKCFIYNFNAREY